MAIADLVTAFGMPEGTTVDEVTAMQASRLADPAAAGGLEAGDQALGRMAPPAAGSGSRCCLPKVF